MPGIEPAHRGIMESLHDGSDYSSTPRRTPASPCARTLEPEPPFRSRPGQSLNLCCLTPIAFPPVGSPNCTGGTLTRVDARFAGVPSYVACLLWAFPTLAMGLCTI
jgi:hypothetical protein